MTRRVLMSIGTIATAVAVFTLTTPSVSGQDDSLRRYAASTPPLLVTAYNNGPAFDYTVPRTPWGDPDLQGVWSSDDTEGIGLQRGGGRGGGPAPTGLWLSDEQFAAREQQVQQRLSGLDNQSGAFRSDFGTRAFRQTSLIVDPPDGRMPAVTPHAQTRRAVRDQGTFGNGPFAWTTDFTLYDRCITRGVVGSILRVIYGNGNRIVQSPGMVAITYEMIHDTRVIYTDGRPHVDDSIRQYLGDARGWWEGDELVVVTTNLTDETSIGLNGNGLRHSDQMRFVERFKRVADDVVQYQVTVDDPITYERPFTISMPLTPLSGGVIMPYECHEGNLHMVRGALAAERIEDQALADDLARGIVRERRGVQETGVGGGGARGRGAGAGGRGGAPAPQP